MQIFRWKGEIDADRGESEMQTVVPGFEFRDHCFLEGGALRELVTAEQAEELKWLVKKGGGS